MTLWEHRKGGGATVLSFIWLWTRDHTGQRALKHNEWLQIQRQLDKREIELPPCLAEPPHPFFIENQIPHHQRHDFDSNSQASDWACGSLSVLSPAKESQFLFCIYVVGEPTTTAVPLLVWQYPAGSLGWSGRGLWSQGAAKTPANFNGDMW